MREGYHQGWRRANYTKSLGENKQWKLKPESEWVWIPVESVVSEELWDSVNDILEEQRRSRKKLAKKPRHVFAGVTFCGTKMYVPSNSPKYVCRNCRNKIPVEDLEAAFQEQLEEFVFSPEDITEHLRQADEGIKTKEELLATLEREQAKVQREMDKVYRAYVDDEVSVQTYGRQFRPLEERFEQLQEEISRLQGELDFLKIQYLSRDEILSEARDLYSRRPRLSRDEKRQIIETIVERITIGDDEIEIELHFLTTPPPDKGPPSGSAGGGEASALQGDPRPSSSQDVTKRQHNLIHSAGP